MKIDKWIDRFSPYCHVCSSYTQYAFDKPIDRFDVKNYTNQIHLVCKNCGNTIVINKSYVEGLKESDYDYKMRKVYKSNHEKNQKKANLNND